MEESFEAAAAAAMAAPAEQGAEQDTEQSSGAPPADTEQEETPQEQDSDGSKARAVSPSAAAGAASPSAGGAAGSDGEAKMDENSAEALETEYLRQPVARTVPAALDGTACGVWLSGDAPERFRQGLELNARPSPEERPFDNKYAGRRIHEQLLAEAKTCLAKDNLDVAVPDAATAAAAASSSAVSTSAEQTALQVARTVVAVLLYHIGINKVETEELGAGEKDLNQALKLLRSVGGTFIGSVHLATLNQLGILWSNRSETDKALEYLQEAHTLHSELSALAADGLAGPAQLYQLIPTAHATAPWREFESIFTHCLFYLAQCYGNKGNREKAGEYIQLTLRRQLETKQYDPKEWAIHAAALSQYYIGINDYATGRHFLASSSHIIAEAVARLPPDAGETEREDVEEKVASIARCWSKYYINLLITSKDILEGAVRPTPEMLGDGHVVRFDLDLPLEREASFLPAKTYKDARKLFQEGQQWVEESRKFFQLDGHVSEYVETVQDLSQLYRLMSSFARDPDDQAKMHKRRVDMLTELADLLSPQHFLLTCRQLRYEAAEAYAEMMQLKMLRLKQGQPPEPKTIAKINKLAGQSKAEFDKFIDLCRDHEKKLPPTVEADLERPLLMAFFWIGKIWVSMQADDIPSVQHNFQKSVEAYKWIVDYCSRNPSAAAAFERELEISREMIELLPRRLERELANMR